MELHKFRKLIDQIDDSAIRCGIDKKVVIQITKHSSIGETPHCNVLRVDEGFDWDSGKIYIVPQDILINKYEN